MNFSPNKTAIEIIKEGPFGVLILEMFVNKKRYRNSWKEFIYLKNIDPKFYASDYYDVNANKYNVKCGTSLRFWEIMMIIQFRLKLDKFYYIGVVN